jgi:hypothetical protein
MSMRQARSMPSVAAATATAPMFALIDFRAWAAVASASRSCAAHAASIASTDFGAWFR